MVGKEFCTPREWHKITNTKGRFTSDYKIVFKDSMSLITFNNILGNWGLMKGVVHWEQEADEELKKEAMSECWIKHWGHENKKRNDHSLKELLTVKQIPFVRTIGNV